MSRRTEQVLDRFVPGPNGGHFVIGTAPLPPHVQRERIVDRVKRTETERVYVDIACPHCKRDVDLEYDAAVAPLNFAREIERTLTHHYDRKLDAALAEAREWTRQVASDTAKQRQNIISDMQVDAMEEWYACRQ